MSPKSRGRKKKPKHGRSTPPDPNAVLRDIVSAFQAVVDETDPLAAEELASSVVGAWWRAGDAGDSFGRDAIGYAATRPGPASLAFLRAIAATGATDDQRNEAGDAAAVLADRGVPDPPWASRIGRVEVGGCWLAADVYRDSAMLLCEFSYGTDPHALLALINFNAFGGAITDITAVAEPEAALRDLRKAAMADGLQTLEQIPPERARQLIEHGIDAIDEIGPTDELGEDFIAFRALALARCRALPEPNEPVAEPPRISDAKRDAIVARFLAESADELPGGDTSRRCARIIVDFGCDYDNGQPERVGPAKIQMFVRGWLPHRVILDEDSLAVMPQVLRAWVPWAAARSGLPAAAVTQVVADTDECADALAETYQADSQDSPTQVLLDGLDPVTPEERQDALDRRLFAVPYSGTVIGDENYPDLDPHDPDDRRLLIIGEHPEFHEALSDPMFDGEVDGVNPRLHVAIDEIVINQLWDGDPPETWAAAQRLIDDGMDRLDIIHALGGVVAHHVYEALRGGEADNDALAADLNALGR